MRHTEKKNAAHYALIRSMMSALPLDAARVLYKCVLANFVVAAKSAQKAASNVGADVASAENLDPSEYLQAVGTLGDQWDRAAKKSRSAFHELRCMDEALILGKLRASIPRYAAGGFDHAIASIDTGEGHKGETLPYDKASENAGMALLAYASPTVEVAPLNEEVSAPAEIINYAVW